jgi:hypothetical protein
MSKKERTNQFNYFQKHYRFAAQKFHLGNLPFLFLIFFKYMVLETRMLL